MHYISCVLGKCASFLKDRDDKLDGLTKRWAWQDTWGNTWLHPSSYFSVFNPFYSDLVPFQWLLLLNWRYLDYFVMSLIDYKKIFTGFIISCDISFWTLKPELFGSPCSASCSLLKGRDSDGFPVYQEKFIRECIRKFPYCDVTLLQQLVRSIAPVEIVSQTHLMDAVAPVVLEVLC